MREMEDTGEGSRPHLEKRCGGDDETERRGLLPYKIQNERKWNKVGNESQWVNSKCQWMVSLLRWREEAEMVQVN